MKIRSRWLTKTASFCAVYALRLLFATCRTRFVGDVLQAGMKKLDDPTNTEFFVLCVWHDALLLPTFAATKPLRRRCCCLVSKHRDGSYLADAMALMDYKTVRGSSHRGGAEAILELLSETAGRHIIITPDGPQGPRRKLKHGAAFLASQLGRGLLPGAFVVNRGWRIRGTWTDIVIPMPFSTIYLITGDPVFVPPDIPRLELMKYVEQAQQAMDRLNEEADRMYAGGAQPEFIEKKKRAA